MSKLILEIDFKGVVCLKCVTVFICTVMMMYFCCMNVSADDLSEISAKSAIVIDGETGDVLFEKNAYERRPMASTTKIMSVLLKFSKIIPRLRPRRQTFCQENLLSYLLPQVPYL